MLDGGVKIYPLNKMFTSCMNLSSVLRKGELITAIAWASSSSSSSSSRVLVGEMK
jgi:hypothetical protein